MKREEGYISFEGFKTWYCKIGECRLGKLPLLVLHGGPGMAHDYLESLNDISLDGRMVIFYDQLGCGKSMVPHDTIDWNVKLWERELAALRMELDLKELHMLGQSWGGMLAMQYAISKPEGVRSMIVASSPASMELWQQEAHRLVNLLPQQMCKAIIQAEATGNYNTVEYKQALDVYYARHVCRTIPYPEYVARSMEQVGEVYEIMEGPSEFTVAGKLKDWDITDDLYKIEIPTLLTSGTDDEATPLIIKQIYDRIPDCKWELLDGTHLVHVEKKELFNRLVTDFITEHETIGKK